ncbi:putative ACR [Fragilaria crotonensis]|nr:putative ACR [Fragilaria crotonensis]
MKVLAFVILSPLLSRLVARCITCQAFVVPQYPFLPERTKQNSIRSHDLQWHRARSNEEDNDDDDDEGDEISLENKDWRAFRAKLVMADAPQQKIQDESVASDESDLDGIGALFGSTAVADGFKMTPLDPSQWAYDSGKVIEQGAVILGGVEQEYGFGLRQQYFHKAAILVLDHDDKQFTKGIILNRPTDLTLDDDINEGVKWRVWFGGDVQGLNSKAPDIVCLHSLKNDQVMRASMLVMNDIQWTTFENAKRLVKVGAAQPNEFWVFCGYAGWGPQQLMGELERKSWYMVAADSQTLLKELARLSAGADPRDAGLNTWDLLMRMIGRKETAEENSGGFDDLMLKEWARKHLLSKEAGGGGGMIQKAPPLGVSSFMVSDSIDDFLESMSSTGLGDEISAGCVVRASSAKRSPFLLDDQELHKSIILVISDDEDLTVGAILNRPAAKGIDVQIKDKATGVSRTEVVPLRYGGQYAIRGTEPLLWLHCNIGLKSAGIGYEIGQGKNGIYKCTADDVSFAIEKGMARPEDFVVVSGVSVWNKGGLGGLARGLQDEVRLGKYEVIPPQRTPEVWRMLLMQDVLSKVNLLQNLAIAGKAWSRGGDVNSKDDKDETPIGGLGENFDEEDDTLVFKSDVKVSDLSDKALRSWVATFLLGAPSLGEF